ncbi:MAG TPA: alpha/beta hydrolase [Vicinamibacterales bacterium]
MSSSMLRRGTVVTMAALGVIGCSSQPATRSTIAAPGTTKPTASLTRVGDQPKGRWARFRATADGVGSDVYIAHTDQPKPVVVLLHGSGCRPEFTVESDGSFHETSVFQDAIGAALDKVHIAVVEQRAVEPLVFSAGMRDEDKRAAYERAGRECSAQYFEQETKPARVADAVAAIEALRGQTWIRGVILAGHSEGTHVVTGVLRQMTGGAVDAAGLFASAGPIPFFGGYVARGAGDRELFKRTFDRVRMLQGADDDFVYQGLPARRWKTFWLDSTPIEDVRDSNVPLFVAQGSRDDTTIPADLFALEAIRQKPGRPIRYVVVDQGDHAFVTPDGHWHMAALFADFLSWALNPKRETSLDVLK